MGLLAHKLKQGPEDNYQKLRNSTYMYSAEKQRKDIRDVDLTSQRYHGPWLLSFEYLLLVWKTIQKIDCYGQNTVPTCLLEPLLQILYQKIPVREIGPLICARRLGENAATY